MSKLKVSICNALKVCVIFHQNHFRKNINLATLLKALREFKSSRDKGEENKIVTYWYQQTKPEIISLADKLFEEEKYIEVYELLNRIRFTKEADVLWRIGRALYYLSLDNKVSHDIRQEMLTEAFDVMNIAMPIGEDCAEVHKWFAIIMNKMGDLVSLEYRVKNFDSVRDHLMKACELNPRDFASHYLLGKWCYDMCNMSWVQRMIAKYIVAKEPPKSTYQEAYKYLSRAEDLQPMKYIPNLYHLGLTCLEIGLNYKGKYYLNLVTHLSPRENSEKAYVTNARHFLKKLERYDLSRRVLFYGDIEDPFN